MEFYDLPNSATLSPLRRQQRFHGGELANFHISHMFALREIQASDLATRLRSRLVIRTLNGLLFGINLNEPCRIRGSEALNELKIRDNVVGIFFLVKLIILPD